MRYRLRTLLIVLALGPAVTGAICWLYRELDPTAAFAASFWLIICAIAVIVAVARLARPTQSPTTPASRF